MVRTPMGIMGQSAWMLVSRGLAEWGSGGLRSLLLTVVHINLHKGKNAAGHWAN